METDSVKTTRVTYTVGRGRVQHFWCEFSGKLHLSLRALHDEARGVARHAYPVKRCKPGARVRVALYVNGAKAYTATFRARLSVDFENVNAAPYEPLRFVQQVGRGLRNVNSAPVIIDMTKDGNNA